MTYKKITVRANDGKCHPAIDDGHGILLCCRCPGSANGTLAARAVKIADGHEAANCRKPKLNQAG